MFYVTLGILCVFILFIYFITVLSVCGGCVVHMCVVRLDGALCRFSSVRLSVAPLLIAWLSLSPSPHPRYASTVVWLLLGL